MSETAAVRTSWRAWLLGLGLVAGLAPPAAAQSLCLQAGGEARCSAPAPGAYTYRLCDYAAPSLSREAAWCAVLHVDGQFSMVNGLPHCAGTPIELDEALLVPKAVELTCRLHGCASAPAEWGGWLGAGEDWDSRDGKPAGYYNGYCADGPPSFVDALETSNVARIRVGGETILARRTRAVACPPGTQPLTGAPLQCASLADASCPLGNPIQPGLGNKSLVEVDLAPVGPSPLGFTRTYNSFGYYRPPGSSDGRPGSLGNHWRSTYDRRLYPVAGGAVLAVAHRPDGSLRYFDGADAELTRLGRTLERVERHVDASGAVTGWTYHSAEDARERYSPEGLLLSIEHRGGLSETLTYSDAATPPALAPWPGLLLEVADPFGRRLTFTRDAEGRIASLTDPGGGVYAYGYDRHHNLRQAQYPDGTLREYHYEDARFPNALTGRTDERGVRLAHYAYDAQGRAITSEHAGGAQRVTMVYNADGSTTVTDAAGGSSTRRFATLAGEVRPSVIEGNPCAGCRAARIAHDAQGFVASESDWRGLTTTYTRDARGRELSRTETDLASGASRTTRYTHSARGHLLSVDGPRTDLADVTTYAYDAAGNLVSITDPLGAVTRILAHDARGRPLELADPSGVRTRYAYDARGRLSEREVGGAPTRYAYNAAGLLVGIDTAGERLTLA